MFLTLEIFYEELEQAGLTDVFFRDLLNTNVSIIDTDWELRFSKITPSNYVEALQEVINNNEDPIIELIDWMESDGGWDVYQDFHDYLSIKYSLRD